MISARLLMAIGSGGAGPASAQSAAEETADAPDKSDYTLFDPTPDGQLRAFCTDRPPKANLSCTVDVGHFQYEADIVNWTNVHTGAITMNIYLFFNLPLKLRLIETVDLEINMNPLETVSITGASGKQVLTRVGDFLCASR